jgi:hypothetical protein
MNRTLIGTFIGGIWVGLWSGFCIARWLDGEWDQEKE